SIGDCGEPILHQQGNRGFQARARNLLQKNRAGGGAVSPRDCAEDPAPRSSDGSAAANRNGARRLGEGGFGNSSSHACASRVCALLDRVFLTVKRRSSGTRTGGRCHTPTRGMRDGN